MPRREPLALLSPWGEDGPVECENPCGTPVYTLQGSGSPWIHP